LPCRFRNAPDTWLVIVEMLEDVNLALMLESSLQ